MGSIREGWGFPFQRKLKIQQTSKILLWRENKAQFSSVQFSLSVVSDSVTPWIAARQASLSITISQSSLRLTTIKSVMPSSHLILCRPLLLLPPIPPRIRVFFSESTLHMRWPKYWSFSFIISPSNEHPDVQAGFRKGRGTRDQIANIRWIIKKARAFQKNIYFCFIDYRKAFDCVDHRETNCGKFWKRWEY